MHLIAVLLAVGLVVGNSPLSADCFSPHHPVVSELSLAYDGFRGISDGSWNGNTGAVAAANFSYAPVHWCSVQLGGSYGLYDWAGRGPVAERPSGSVQQQGFVTAGAIADQVCCWPVRAAVAFDLMLNKNFGVFALNPNLGQMRLEAGYLWQDCHEFGLWGTVNVNTDKKRTYQIPVSFRAVSQVSLYWRYLFQCQAESMVWIGWPYRKSLMFPSKRAGEVLVGGSVRVPLSDCLDLEARGLYLAQSGNAAVPRYRTYGATICLGISYTFGLGSSGCCAFERPRSRLSMANNSNFLVDTTLND